MIGASAATSSAARCSITGRTRSAIASNIGPMAICLPPTFPPASPTSRRCLAINGGRPRPPISYDLRRDEGRSRPDPAERTVMTSISTADVSRGPLDASPMTGAQIMVLGLAILLATVDGYDLLGMAFVAPA